VVAKAMTVKGENVKWAEIQQSSYEREFRPVMGGWIGYYWLGFSMSRIPQAIILFFFRFLSY
jgi:hypothetical protein